MDITKLSAQEILLVNELAKLAAEAKEASEKIKSHFKNSFGIGNSEIEVYHTESCGEYYGYGYLNIDGEFRYYDNWWGGRQYIFQADTEGIYKMFRSCYLRKNNLKDLDPEEFNCQIEHIDSYFREFINQIDDAS